MCIYVYSIKELFKTTEIFTDVLVESSKPSKKKVANLMWGYDIINEHKEEDRDTTEKKKKI